MKEDLTAGQRGGLTTGNKILHETKDRLEKEVAELKLKVSMYEHALGYKISIEHKEIN